MWHVPHKRGNIMRKEINSIVRTYALLQGGKFEEAWNKLYNIYNKVMKQNVKSRATKRHTIPLSVIEQDGNLEILKILAINL